MPMVAVVVVVLTAAQGISLLSRTGKTEASAAAVVVAEAILRVAGMEASAVAAVAGLIAALEAAWGAVVAVGVGVVVLRAVAVAVAVSAAAFLQKAEQWRLCVARSQATKQRGALGVTELVAMAGMAAASALTSLAGPPMFCRRCSEQPLEAEL